MDINSSKLQEIVKDREAWYAAVHELSKSWMQFSIWKITRSGAEEEIHFGPQAYTKAMI